LCQAELSQVLLHSWLCVIISTLSFEGEHGY